MQKFSEMIFNGKVRIVCGTIQRDSNFGKFIMNCRSLDNYSQNFRFYNSKGEEIREYIREEFKNVSLISDNFKDVILETSRLEAPCKHKIKDVHSDGDEYGKGITLLVYPRVDNSLVDGCLRIPFMNVSIEEGKELCNKVNSDIGYEIISYKQVVDYDNGELNYEFVFNNRCNEYDNIMPFIIFDSDVEHQVENINGSGTRETIFYFLSENNIYNIYNYEDISSVIQSNLK